MPVSFASTSTLPLLYRAAIHGLKLSGAVVRVCSVGLPVCHGKRLSAEVPRAGGLRGLRRLSASGQQEKQRRMYHNTTLLLEQYRNIAWALECFPDTIAAELDHPLGDLDSLLGKMDLEMGLGNRKLESRLESVKKSRLLLDRVNEALTVLKRKPDNGPKMYELIYQTYLAPEKLSHADLLYRLDISSRHYYRLRQQAITILSIRLWSAPSNEVDSWLEILTLLESL